MRRASSVLFLTLLLMAMLPLAFKVPLVKAGTIIVPDDYPTIQGAINNANSGDTIIVSEGNYSEGDIIISKSDLSLIANGTVVVCPSIWANNVFNVTGSNTTIDGFIIKHHNLSGHGGIRLSNVSNCLIRGNSLTENGEALDIYQSNGNTIEENIITNNDYGIILTYSENNTITGNTLVYNSHGLHLGISGGNILRDNNITNCTWNFGISGGPLSDFSQDIDISNTVNGKPIYYLFSKTGLTVDSSLFPDIGYLGIINSTNIIVRDVNLTKNSQGLLFAYVTNSTIEEINTFNNIAGIHLYRSSNNIIKANLVKSNYNGIYLDKSDNNTIRNNTVAENKPGIFLKCSINNTVKNNNITNNTATFGIDLESSHSNTIKDNLITHNGWGIHIYNSANNSVNDNIIASNTWAGIWMEHSDDNVFHGNEISNHTDQPSGLGIMLVYSSENIIFHNNFINNTHHAFSHEYSGINAWDGDYPLGGNYWSDYNGIDLYSGFSQNVSGSDGIGDTPYVIDDGDNIDHYPLMKPYPWSPHDIGLTNVNTSKTVVGEGYTLNISIMIFNYGNFSESFSVSAHYNGLIGTHPVVLGPRTSTTITMLWNTTGIDKQNYTITAYLTAVQGETDLTDNTLMAEEDVCLTIPGDVDADFNVGLYDAVKLLLVYGVEEGEPGYDPNLDINGNGQIFLYDVVILLTHYGEKYP